MMERQYKESGIEWIGRIPEGWMMSAIKRLMRLYAGATPKSDNESFWDGDIAWVTPADYKTEDVYISRGRRNISIEGLNSCATTILPVNSIIFSKRAPIGLVVLNREPICTNQGCIGCVPLADKAKSKYYYYVLCAFTEQFDLLGSGTTFKEISANSFANFIVPTPPLPEQQRIASYLDKKCGEIDALIALQEKIIAQLTEYKQAVITEAVTKGLDPNAKLVPSGIEWIEDVPEGWKVCKLKNVFIVSDGTHDTPNYVEKSNDSYPLVTSKCIVDGEICVDLANHISKADYLLINERSYHRKYDVIMPMIGTVGNPAIVMTNEEYALKNVAIFRTGGKYNKAALLKYFINSSVFTEQLNYKKRGGVQNFVSQDILNNLILIMPNNLEEIIAYLDSKCSEIDTLIALKRQKIESLNAYKKSVIYEAVTGKTMI